MKPLTDRRRVIEATAKILSSEPHISNLVLLKKLALEVGAAVVSEIPINRVRRQVREPALEYLRTGTIPPAPAEVVASGLQARRKSEVPQPEKPRGGKGRKGAEDRGAQGAPGRNVAGKSSAEPPPSSPAGKPSPKPRPSSSTRKPSTATAPSKPARSPASERRPRRSRRRLRTEIDQAILEAFTLGLDASSRGKTVEAFREIEALQERVGRSLEKG